MYKRTPCYDCKRPERLPNGLCEKGCKVKADYLAEKAEHIKQEQIRKGLNYYTGCIIDRGKKKSKNLKRKVRILDMEVVKYEHWRYHRTFN